MLKYNPILEQWINMSLVTYIENRSKLYWPDVWEIVAHFTSGDELVLNESNDDDELDLWLNSWMRN